MHKPTKKQVRSVGLHRHNHLKSKICAVLWLLWIRSTICDPPSHSILCEERVFFFCLNETVFYSSAVPQRGEGRKHLEDIFPFFPALFSLFFSGISRQHNDGYSFQMWEHKLSLSLLESQTPRNKRKPAMLVHLWLLAAKTHISHDALGCSSHADTELAALAQVCRECYSRGSVCTCVSFMTAQGNLRLSEGCQTHTHTHTHTHTQTPLN